MGKLTVGLDEAGRGDKGILFKKDPFSPEAYGRVQDRLIMPGWQDYFFTRAVIRNDSRPAKQRR